MGTSELTLFLIFSRFLICWYTCIMECFNVHCASQHYDNRYPSIPHISGRYTYNECMWASTSWILMLRETVLITVPLSCSRDKCIVPPASPVDKPTSWSVCLSVLFTLRLASLSPHTAVTAAPTIRPILYGWAVLMPSAQLDADTSASRKSH